MVQECMSAKEAWDLLEAFSTETRRMKKEKYDVSPSCHFNSHLSSPCQEVVVLKKVYKDKRFIKEFLRNLSHGYLSHKSDGKGALSSDEQKVDQGVKLVHTDELQMRKNDQKAEESFTLKTVETQTSVQDNEEELIKKQFRRLKGYGHFQPDYFTLKRKSVLKCYNRQGCGHTKSCLTWRDIESAKEDNENQKSVLKPKDDVASLSVKKQVIALSKNLILQKKENYDLVFEKEELLCRVFTLKKLLSEEKVISSLLSQRLENQLKNNNRLRICCLRRKGLITHKGTVIANCDMRNHGRNSSRDTSVVNGSLYGQKISYIGHGTKELQNGGDAVKHVSEVNIQKTKQMIVMNNLRGKLCRCPEEVPQGWKKRTISEECHKDVRRYRRVNIKKRDMNYYVAHTVDVQQTVVLKHWFFDSGSSRHMTVNQGRLQNFEEGLADMVTFGDEAEGKIRGKGVSRCKDQPTLEFIYLVDGLKTNLISSSWLCDEGLAVTFTEKGCQAVDECHNIRVKGQRSDNSYYI
ncbi:PREDICTED: uncharacterized protein LOC104767866 [Camelina sativa]|uniref:Uncharacterized protein LOC104767866 n=1 Tax=Camelina sativa TaxID=90675 RepID=A0ABM1RBR9_CAMSA|nr:PREDICTED: uncharacterized protein LOC104767866 [Camelina sativa]